MRRRSTALADADQTAIFRATAKRFGYDQLLAYADLIDGAIGLVCREPTRASSRSRPDLGLGIRSIHVATASPRRRAASHIIYYAVRPAPDGDQELVVLRILHEAMEPKGRVARALKSDA